MKGNASTHLPNDQYRERYGEITFTNKCAACPFKAPKGNREWCAMSRRVIIDCPHQQGGLTDEMPTT